MWSYLARRVLLAVPTLALITMVTFTITRLAPGSPADLLAGGEGAAGRIDERTIEETRKRFRLDKPIPVQYALWVRDIATLEFGTSFQDGLPVTEKVWDALKVSLFLQVVSLAIIYLVAVPIGIISAVHHDKLPDKIIGVLLFVLYSLPNFWLATLLIVYLGGGQYLDVFPIAWLRTPGSEAWSAWDRAKDLVWHLVLPVACLTYGSLAGLSRYARVGMLDVIRQDYIRTARAKGLSERVVVLKHVARNGLIPIVTLAASILPALIGGSVIIETIFSVPGMGLLGFQAITTRDYPIVMATLTLAALLTLVGVLVSDLLYVLVDPRITFERLRR